MKKITMILVWATILLALSGCKKSEEENIELKSTTHIIPIEMDISKILLEAKPGDEVPSYVTMYKSTTAYTQQIDGDANLSIEVEPGDEVIWKLVSQSDGHILEITNFIFEVQEGENFFTQSDGTLPQKQPDNSWKAKVSPSALDGSTLKYSIYFTLDGQTYWWDPFIKNRSNPGN